ncbi:MAG: hypothetical protein NT118_02425 [Lentisphaerae bacterium]|nr:hypothetical protein [Lentisphaerota bacterium]
MLRKRLKTLIPAEKAELAETNKKIAILEKRENEINEMRQIAKAVEGEMRSCGYNIIEPYVPAKSLTGEYIKKMIDTNFAYCNVNAVNAANNANPRQGEYTLASVFSDIEDNIVINDYKFGYKDRIKADRLITINFLEKKEAGDSNNYIFDIKCRIDVVNAKDSGKIGSVEVWGRYLSGVARKSGNSSKSTGNPFVQARKDMTKNPGIRPIDRNIVNQIMDEKSIAFVEAGRDMGRNLLTIPEFMELVTGKKQ